MNNINDNESYTEATQLVQDVLLVVQYLMNSEFKDSTLKYTIKERSFSPRMTAFIYDVNRGLKRNIDERTVATLRSAGGGTNELRITANTIQYCTSSNTVCVYKDEDSRYQKYSPIDFDDYSEERYFQTLLMYDEVYAKNMLVASAIQKYIPEIMRSRNYKELTLTVFLDDLLELANIIKETQQ